MSDADGKVWIRRCAACLEQFIAPDEHTTTHCTDCGGTGIKGSKVESDEYTDLEARVLLMHDGVAWSRQDSAILTPVPTCEWSPVAGLCAPLTRIYHDVDVSDVWGYVWT